MAFIFKSHWLTWCRWSHVSDPYFQMERQFTASFSFGHGDYAMLCGVQTVDPGRTTYTLHTLCVCVSVSLQMNGVQFRNAKEILTTGEERFVGSGGKDVWQCECFGTFVQLDRETEPVIMMVHNMMCTCRYGFSFFFSWSGYPRDTRTDIAIEADERPWATL